MKTRNYKEEYAKYHSSPEDRKRRSSRNKARRKMIKWGKIRKGDSRDVDHKNGNPLTNSRKNLSATSVKYNRGRNNNKGR